MKWPKNKRVDPLLASAVITVGVGGTFGIPAILASLHASDPHYPWAWPTNWMAVPAALLVIGLGLLVVPVRWVEPAGPTPPFDSGLGKYSITFISAELEQWHAFFAEATKNRWINFFDQMPAADGLVADDGSPRYVLPDSLKVNLIRVYRYLAALVEAHDRIKRWHQSDHQIKSGRKGSEDSGIGDAVTDAAATVIASVSVFFVQYGWLGRRLRRAQLKNQEYQERLQQLPDILSALRDDLKTPAAGGSIGSKAYAPVELPTVPVIEVGSHGSIDFELVPLKSYIPDARTARPS
jgi:hypothetical protein